MKYYIINTDAKNLGASPHDTWMEQGFAFTGGEIHYGELLGKLEVNDICFMYVNKNGVMAAGRVLEKWDEKVYSSPVIYGGDSEYRIKMDWFLDLRSKPVGVSEVGDITGIPPTTLQLVNSTSGEALLNRCSKDFESPLPDEISDADALYEGAIQRISVNAYERDSKARQRCIDFYGTDCFICGFDFATTYGKVGKGLIFVHHLKPLSEVGEEYEVDPVDDLRPVCPNCHAIIHRRKPAYGIEEVKEFLLWAR